MKDVAVQTEQPLSEVTSGELMMNLPLLQQIDTMAVRMASSKATVPDHLRGNEGDCWAIIMQAIQWGMNPYVVAQKTHVVSGRLGYEAQLVNAVVQSSGMLEGSFSYEYRGEGESLECRVGAVLKGKNAITWNEWLMLANVKVRNSPLWKTNQKQQLGYLQMKNWVRLYTPGPILGVYTTDELSVDAELKDVTPIAGESADPAAPREDSRTSAVKKQLLEDDVEDAVVVEPEPAPEAVEEPAPKEIPEDDSDRKSVV